MAGRCMGWRDPRRLAIPRSTDATSSSIWPAVASIAGTPPPTARRFCSRVCCRRELLDRRSRGQRASHGVAAGEHCHDLCAPVRQPERRALGHPRRKRTNCTERLAIQHPRGARVGARFRGGRRRRTRKVALRSAMTLSPDRWRHLRRAPRSCTPRPRRHAPATAGNSSRGFTTKTSFAAVRWLIDREDIDGVVNVAAPNPLPNAEFMRVLREAYGAPFGLPAAKWMLEIGAVFMRTETELILKSRRVVPARLLEHGFTFRYPEWSRAARDLCRHWKSCHARRSPRTVPDVA